ncbi:B-cell antigen receptor complex-associated protein alpha chain [Lates japonicus]|uniref:B-cell antigen receptor complex-associated protein alpha chain n=1 Tax=Lates japonicus TaxID=270547 RepID=A0AAD3NJ78_LATJO|nr:B-cell antigen receptor complex-associated protein alpha chain [Lates japonicus]
MEEVCRRLHSLEEQLKRLQTVEEAHHRLQEALSKFSLEGRNFQILSHGTYLQVYKPLEKTLNFSESTKNGILTAEGILLLLCVVLPSATLLCKSKKVHEIEKKKMKKEEENIYQGLNLDDCCTTYDQIERSQALGPYQDVCNIMEEEEEIQLEKP